MAQLPNTQGNPRNIPDPSFDEAAARARIVELEALIAHAEALGHPFERGDEEYGSGRVPQDEIDEIEAKLQFGPWRAYPSFSINTLMELNIRESIVNDMFRSASMLGVMRARQYQNRQQPHDDPVMAKAIVDRLGISEAGLRAIRGESCSLAGMHTSGAWCPRCKIPNPADAYPSLPPAGEHIQHGEAEEREQH